MFQKIDIHKALEVSSFIMNFPNCSNIHYIITQEKIIKKMTKLRGGKVGGFYIFIKFLSFIHYPSTLEETEIYVCIILFFLEGEEKNNNTNSSVSSETLMLKYW